MSRSLRTQDCSQDDALKRFRRAQAFLEVAELVSNEDDPEDEYANVSSSLAVLAGIAASDAACCCALKKRSRSNDHRDAINLVEQVTPGGKAAARSLKNLIDLKDSAQYGVITVSKSDVKRSLRQADQLVTFARDVVSS